MSQIILIYGESGTGKSTAIENLPSNETFIISILGKPLPFKGWKIKYTTDNFYKADKADQIIHVLKNIKISRPHTKYIVIDDFQYLMCNEFMRRISEVGYNKFSQIAQNAWNVINTAQELPEDILVFFLSHSETDQYGKVKIKTIGKLLDDKICLEGMFNIVLNSQIIENRYLFLTQNNGNTIAKSPKEMFEDIYIENDLMKIATHLKKYEEEEGKLLPTNKKLFEKIQQEITECKNSKELEKIGTRISTHKKNNDLTNKDLEKLTDAYTIYAEKLMGI